jgi:hypothetical protein
LDFGGYVEKSELLYSGFILLSSIEMSPAQGLSIDADLVSEILEFQGNYRDAKEKAMCQRMVEALSPEEEEIAARTSYTYWMRATTDGGCPSKETRKRMAMKEARRHLVGEDGKYENAMDSLRETCRFRKVRSSLRKPVLILTTSV